MWPFLLHLIFFITRKEMHKPILKTSLQCHLLVYTECVKRDRLKQNFSLESTIHMHRPGIRMRGQQTAADSSRQRRCLAGACELTQPPTEAVQGPWPGLAATGPCLSCAVSCQGGELALAGSHTPAQLLHLPAGQERKQEDKEQENSLVGI